MTSVANNRPNNYPIIEPLQIFVRVFCKTLNLEIGNKSTECKIYKTKLLVLLYISSPTVFTKISIKNMFKNKKGSHVVHVYKHIR